MSTQQAALSARARIRRHSDRSVPDEVADILAKGAVAHVGFSQDDQPFVIPFAYHVDASEPNRVYLHGSIASRALRHLASGAPVCITVTLLDGLVYSRGAFTHSMNYRSVVGFGRARQISDHAEMTAILERMTARLFPGRTMGVDYTAATASELRTTSMVVVEIEEWSGKARRGGPKGPLDGDASAPGNAGVIELRPDERPNCPAH